MKVLDACDSYSTYCIITKTKSKLPCVPMENTLKDAKNLVIAGHKEISLSDYGLCTARKTQWPQDENENFIELIEGTSKNFTFERIERYFMAKNKQR